MKLYLVVFVCIVLASGRSIPDYFPQCRRADPKIEKCILDGIEIMRPKLKQGIPEVNLPSLDPFAMDILNVDTFVMGFKFKPLFTNIVAHGGSDFKIKNLKLDLDNKYVVELEMLFPHVEVSADYDTRGSNSYLIGAFNVGKVSGYFNDLSVVTSCKASPVVKNGVEYLELDSIRMQLSSRGGYTSVHSNGMMPLNMPSSSIIMNILRPAIDETAVTVVQQYLSDVLSAIPLRDVLID